MLTVVILTRDESLHLARAIRSVQQAADRIFVVDSGSTDDTVIIANAHGAEVLVHPFTTQAKQFNWALEQLPEDTEWVFRLDADEIVSPELVRSLVQVLPDLPVSVAGASVDRRITFLRHPIRWGGICPVRITRVLRYGRGRSEDRWMDEHIKVAGATVRLGGELIDDNLNFLSWWTDKHNRYASREAVDLLNLEYRFMPHDTVASLRSGSQAGPKRWLKERVYARLPAGFRALAYFLYRYVIRMGFLDGRVGFTFHFLQGFWYRYLVDAKVAEVKQHMLQQDVHVTAAIERVLGIKLGSVAKF